MSDEEQVMAKPPSHPVATGLLIASAVGLTLNIAIVSQELFTSYLNEKTLKNAKREKPIHDHYKADSAFKASIEEDLELTDAK